MFKKGNETGFTLVELIVVIGIIILMLGVLFVSIVEIRKNSRDKQRVSEISGIQFVLNIYKEKNRSYPSYDGGIEIGVGEPIDGDLAPYMPQVVGDPLSSGTDGDFGYWYDSAFDCGGVIQPALIVRTMEKSGGGNYDELCDSSSMVPVTDTPFIKTANAGYGQGSYYGQANYYQQGIYYSQATYYTQGAYYSQSGYYNQGAYYSESAYSSQNLDLSGNDPAQIYILLLENAF